MPLANIERAVKKGTGELPGVVYEEKTYEGYGPGGVAVLIETQTENTNRTTSDVRHLLSKHGGNLGETGCVSWMFEKKGLFIMLATACEEDRLMELVLEAGGEDLTRIDEVFEIITPPEAFAQVKAALEKQSIPVESSEITMIPKTTIKVTGKQAEQNLRLMETLEEYDDVQHVYSNFDIDEQEAPA
jgi:YebC/PmpR family DNA-binding regulatory protein